MVNIIIITIINLYIKYNNIKNNNNLDTQSDNPKKQLKFSACKFLPSAKYLGMFREELIGSNQKKKERKKEKSFSAPVNNL